MSKATVYSVLNVSALAARMIKSQKKSHTKADIGANLQLALLEKYTADKWMVFFYTSING